MCRVLRDVVQWAVVVAGRWLDQMIFEVFPTLLIL